MQEDGLFGIDRRLVQNFDWTLLLLITSIVAIGILNLASATHIDDELTGEVRRQLLSLGLGGVAMLVALAIAAVRSSSVQSKFCTRRRSIPNNAISAALTIVHWYDTVEGADGGQVAIDTDADRRGLRPSAERLDPHGVNRVPALRPAVSRRVESGVEG